MKPVRVGLIGYGFSGRVFHAPVLAAAPSVELVAVASSDAARVRSDWPGMHVVTDVDALLRDPFVDAVVVATPNTTHAELALRALEAGKHTVVEKPFVNRSDDAGPLLRAAAEHGRVLSAYHNRRWDGDFLTLRRLVEEGAVGDVVHFESHFDRFRPEIKRGWREEPGDGAGILYDLGSHLIDQALVLFGPPRTVWADLATQRPDGLVEDYFHVVLGWGRRRAILHSGTLVRDPGPRFAVHGTAGTITTWGMDVQEAQLRGHDSSAARPHGRLVRGAGDEPDSIAIPAGRYPDFYDALAAAIQGEGPNPVPATDAVEVVRIIEAAFRSSREGRRVTLEE